MFIAVNVNTCNKVHPELLSYINTRDASENKSRNIFNRVSLPIAKHQYRQSIKQYRLFGIFV